MKNILRTLSLAGLISIAISACSKVDNLRKEDPLPVYLPGSSSVLSSSVATVAPVLADTAMQVVTFSWTNPKYGNDSTTTKYIIEADTTGGTFAKAEKLQVIGNLSKSLTGRELNAMLLDLGFKTNISQSVDVRLISSYGNNNEQYTSNVIKLAVTPFSDPSVLTGSATSVTLELVNAANQAIDFKWSTAFTGYTGAISYTLQYDSTGKNFSSPQDFGAATTSLIQSLKQSELNATAINEGVAAGTPGKIDYRIKATTAGGAVVYSNTFSVAINTYVTILRFYLPGGYQSATGNGDDWTPDNAPEFIRDQRTGLLNNMYYLYIYIPGGQEFKITQGRSWDINYGGTGGTLSRGGNNLSVPTSGFYRISINVATLKYDIREGRMGFVGGATGAGWTPPNVFPAYAFGAAGTNLFVGITNLASGEWKMIDNNEWNNGSNTVDETRSYGTKSASGSSLEINGGNFDNTNPAGRYRAIWDGRDRDNVKYEISPATEMRIVGDGIQGVADWTPGVSPQMNYLGNGVWSLTVALKANKDIKFLAGNDWGAFDYEDNSGGSNTTGVDRKIKWEGGSNFKTPATDGTYTIILNENEQTVSIN